MSTEPRDPAEYYRVAEVALSTLGTDERALEVNAIAAAILATVPARSGGRGAGFSGCRPGKRDATATATVACRAALIGVMTASEVVSLPR